jgi:hypothetical protein
MNLNVFSSQENDLVFCNDICYVMEAIGHQQWNICGDLKVIALLLGLRLGYTVLSTAVFCVNGTGGTEKTITSKNSGRNEIHLFQERKMC